MVYEQDQVIAGELPSFEAMLDTTCERLMDKQVRYSLRRIGEMEEELFRLEKELDEFLNRKTGYA